MNTSKSDSIVDKVQNDLHQLLKRHANQTNTQCELDYLLTFQQVLEQANGNVVKAIDQFLADLFMRLSAENEQYAMILQSRFVGNVKARAVANHLDIAESGYYVLQRSALTRAAELLLEAELAAQTARRLQMERLLEPPTYSSLVGVESLLEQLLGQIRMPGAPWLLALQGMGGLGKTSLANALMRHIVHKPAPFVNVGWVTARAAHFDFSQNIVAEAEPALTVAALVDQLWRQLCAEGIEEASFSNDQKRAMLHDRLRRQPHLIVIDNLETLVDVNTLLPLLQSLKEPTKFLLTSRERVGNGVGVYHITVPPLSEEDALRLIRQEAALANLPFLAQAEHHQLAPIYETVGGNPLALRLIVGQAHTQPLSTILADLREKRSSRIEQLYTYLYWRAWEQLDDPARMVWLQMPLLAEGLATSATLIRHTELPEEAVHMALEQLSTLNLINCHNNLTDTYFSLHNLTRTFLLSEVVQWQLVQ